MQSLYVRHVGTMVCEYLVHGHGRLAPPAIQVELKQKRKLHGINSGRAQPRSHSVQSFCCAVTQSSNRAHMTTCKNCWLLGLRSEGWKRAFTRTYCANVDKTQAADTLFSGTIDRHKGIWVDFPQSAQLCSPDGKFKDKLEASLLSWQQSGLLTVWLVLDLSQGNLMAVAERLGFRFHHAEGKKATLVLGLDGKAESRVPMFATHQVGVSGIVVKEETREVLVVQDKGRPYTLWKFPGGLSDLGEDIAETAMREVFEETGLKTEFQSILAFRQQHNQPGAFGRSDMYILCRLKPLTFELKPCEEEIAACQWMRVDDLKAEVHASSITHRLAEVIIAGLTNGWDTVDIGSEKMKSIYKGKMFHLFHRPLLLNKQI